MMFTREQWKGDFTDCCKPGEEISEELYWNFLNAADPIELNPQSKMCGFQLGEPHDHVPCKDGKCVHGMQHSGRTAESIITSEFLQKEGRTTKMCCLKKAVSEVEGEKSGADMENRLAEIITDIIFQHTSAITTRMAVSLPVRSMLTTVTMPKTALVLSGVRQTIPMKLSMRSCFAGIRIAFSNVKMM
ncbi:MAG: hypothetical protein ACLUFV_06860 [Acutalibacteraceae bacterium]